MKAKKLIRLQRAGLFTRSAWITTDDMATHVQVTGGIGSGKTNCILAELVRENVRAGSVMLVFAGKATDANTFERFITQGGGAAPLRLGSDPNLYFPFLEYLDGLGMSSPDIASVLKEAAAAMKQSGEIGAESEDWQARALDLITKTFILRRLVGPLSLIPVMKLLGRLPSIPSHRRLRQDVFDEAGRLVAESEIPMDGNIPAGWQIRTSPNVVLSPEWAELVAAARLTNRFEVQEALQYMLETWPQMNDRTATSITSQFVLLLSRLGQEPLLSLLCAHETEAKTAVTPDTLFHEGRHVIVDVPTTSNPESGRAAQAIFQRSMRLAMVHREFDANGRVKGPLVVGVLDEFQQSVSDAKSLLELMQISREFRYGLVLSTQNVSNVVFRFGLMGANAILGLPETKIVARNTDMTTCQMISDAVGVEEYKLESIQKTKDGRISTTITPQERPRVRPERIARLKKVKWTRRGRPRAETIVLHDGEAYFVWWDGLPRGWDRLLRSFWAYRERDRGVPALAALLTPIALNLGEVSAPSSSMSANAVATVSFRSHGAQPQRCVRTTRYVVRPGDLLSRIAHKHGTSVRRIASANELTDPNLIEVGDVLMVPDQRCDASKQTRLAGRWGAALDRGRDFWTAAHGLYAGLLAFAVVLLVLVVRHFFELKTLHRNVRPTPNRRIGGAA